MVFPTWSYLQANLPQSAAIHKIGAGSEPGSAASFPRGGWDHRWQPGDVYKHGSQFRDLDAVLDKTPNKTQGSSISTRQNLKRPLFGLRLRPFKAALLKSRKAKQSPAGGVPSANPQPSALGRALPPFTQNWENVQKTEHQGHNRLPHT